MVKPGEGGTRDPYLQERDVTTYLIQEEANNAEDAMDIDEPGEWSAVSLTSYKYSTCTCTLHDMMYMYMYMVVVVLLCLV